MFNGKQNGSPHLGQQATWSPYPNPSFFIIKSNASTAYLLIKKIFEIGAA